MANQDSFDLSARSFDLLEGREFRRETMLQYGVQYRIRQLRILFFASTAVTAAAFPYLRTELFFADGPMDLTTVAAIAATILGSSAAALSEKKSRGRKLLRIERELQLAELSIWQPKAALGGGTARTSLEALRGKRRVLAVCGPPAVLGDFMETAAVYRRRLMQSSIALVIITDASDVAAAPDDEEFAALADAAESEGWLYRPTELQRWKQYFTDLLAGRATTSSGAWLALSLRGRSVGSGVGLPPIDELLGTQLPPLTELSPDEPPASARSEAEGAVLAAQAKLYAAISAADAPGVEAMCAEEPDGEVTALAVNGRLDEWSTALKYEATVGLRLSSQDAWVAKDGTAAWTTGLEFPLASPRGASLLCTQKWVKTGAANEEWQLQQHRTIPFAANVDAPACLRCDRRGCVALQRVGLRGPAGMPGDGRA